MTSSKTDDDSDVEIIELPQQCLVNRVFYPTSKYWRRSKCRILKLNMSSDYDTINNCTKSKVLSNPSKIRQIRGDGNCLFRALSFWVSGTEENHFSLRQHICQIVKTNKAIQRYIGGHQDRSLMENNGAWGTDVEIYGAAILLRTPIYVYMTAGNKWHLFQKEITLKKLLSPRERCIYIRNDYCHYDVVLDVE